MPRRPRRFVTIADLVDDAMLVARSAVRQQVKNLILVRALRDGIDFDADEMADAARGEFLALADELEADAARIATTIAEAGRKQGPARHVTDYRSADARPLRRRRKVLLEQAVQLRGLARSDMAVHNALAEARTLALDEIAAASAAASGRTPGGALSPSERRIALGDLADDLIALQLERTERTAPPD